jgi:FAD/FMN-containing dehydrogenase
VGVTSIKAAMARVAEHIRYPVPGTPEAEWIIAPETTEQLIPVLQQASDHQLKVLVWGGGTHQGFGYRLDPDIVIATARLDRTIAWEPDDLTVVVEGGVRLQATEIMLADRGQTTALPEHAGEATIGGVVAAGVSGFRRARYGPTRDRVLEVTVVTGDGRLVRGGGRVVKNVTGYDLPRLITGSLGSLGVIVSVCLKLWPMAERSVTMPLTIPSELGRSFIGLWRSSRLMVRHACT